MSYNIVRSFCCSVTDEKGERHFTSLEDAKLYIKITRLARILHRGLSVTYDYAETIALVLLDDEQKLLDILDSVDVEVLE